MKIVNTGIRYEIYDDNLKTYNKLPAKTYVIRFHKMTGFFLEQYPDMEIKESKVYGVHSEKVEKVMRSFDAFERNLGVILSGDKGIGKSLFAKMLSIRAVEQGIPVIIVDTYYPGISSYIEQIQQEVLILFDEFDKTFGSIKSENNEAEPQAGLLTLFDGISPGKKMFVITCNSLSKLNDYLINRPGRFHYHFRFDYPREEEIETYLKDKLKEEYYGEIRKVTFFSKKAKLNYDCLRAIAFELNNGLKFKDAIRDLNIINTETPLFNVKVYLDNGEVKAKTSEYIDFFAEEEKSFWVCTSDSCDLEITFNTGVDQYDKDTGNIIIKGDDLKYYWDEEDKLYEQYKNCKVKKVEFEKDRGKRLHYIV